ncbi:DUF2244 domain-containing protein [Phenylobacterium sp.]|uniref:DUF2244 domain-containing protein n=1 Tax=Phenylobacterium sp. TaxID=1871053 RepID=UPI00273699AA|nr:DUF2244 domain-containing protein [Phenylobacterium sp.]MDP3661038.1 DUF2244 domain-containing protein [Phenylobacterium sp.]
MDAALYMDAVITPNRSLSERGFVVLIGVVTGFNCVAAAVFMSMGATFVPLFLGLDVLAVVIAFLVSFAAAKHVERVQVTARDVRVVRETPRRSDVIWESPTAFTRVALEVVDEQLVGLKLALSGKAVPVAQALSPDERQEFARALQRAIREARGARV